MGFLDNTSISVDAILTKVGRRRLSQGTFNITRFALSDEEIDYKLYDVTHPNGSDSYGAVIENMNLIEASAVRNSFMSYLVNDSLTGAKINIGTTSWTNVDKSTKIPINPSTEGAPAEEYTFTIQNTNIVRFQAAPSLKSRSGPSAIVIAQSFSSPTPNATTTVTVTGNDSGIVKTITISVNADPVSPNDAEGAETDDVPE